MLSFVQMGCGLICYLLGDRSCEQEVAILTVLQGATGFIKVGVCTRFSSRPTRVYGSIGVGHEPGFSAVLLGAIGFIEVSACTRFFRVCAAGLAKIQAFSKILFTLFFTRIAAAMVDDCGKVGCIVFFFDEQK